MPYSIEQRREYEKRYRKTLQGRLTILLNSSRSHQKERDKSRRQGTYELSNNGKASKRYRNTLKGRLMTLLGSSKYNGIRTRGTGFSFKKFERQLKVKDKNRLSYEFLLSLYDQQRGICAWSGIPIAPEDGPFQISIDRLDIDGPYSKDNVVLCAYMVNCFKNKYNPEDMVRLARGIMRSMGHLVK